MLWIADGVSVALRPGPGIEGTVSYGPVGQFVNAGSEGEFLDHAGHFTGGIIGDVDWTGLSQAINSFDEYRFCRSCLSLVSVAISVSEFDEGLEADTLDIWRNSDLLAGSVVLSRSVDDFNVECAVASRFSDREVIALQAGALGRVDGVRVRVQVARGFYLLFMNGFLCGWILQEPELCIASRPGGLSRYPRDEVLARVLRDYMGLVSDPMNFDLMQEGDIGLKEALVNMADALAGGRGAVDRREILLECIGDTIRNWFSDLGR